MTTAQPPVPPHLFKDFFKGLTGDKHALLRARRRVYEIVESGHGIDKGSRRFDAFIIFLIIANIIAFMLETVKSIQSEWGWWLNAFEVFSVIVFTLEYVARLWTAVEVPFLAKLGPIKSRWEMAKRPYLIIDLLAVLPFWLAAMFSLDLRVLRVLRLLRFFKLSRYSPAMHTLVRVLGNERRSLAGAGMLLMAALLVSASVMYYLEHDQQPDKFSSVPAAAYWAMTTLTTVGYGDLSPETPLGRLWAMVTMLVGLCVLALPVAIISTGFAQEAGRRDFVVTWSLMSRIPLLAELEAAEVALVMPLLHARNVPPRTEIIQAGSPGDAMYFVASGGVTLKTPKRQADFKQGDFFGTIAMLDGDLNQGSFSTVSRSRLLKLHREDFVRLEQINPHIAAHIRKIAAERRRVRDLETDNSTRT
ncbi:MAG: hypothetical protein RL291_500 [Pseudomonadota bacterium]